MTNKWEMLSEHTKRNVFFYHYASWGAAFTTIYVVIVGRFPFAALTIVGYVLVPVGIGYGLLYFSRLQSWILEVMPICSLVVSMICFGVWWYLYSYGYSWVDSFTELEAEIVAVHQIVYGALTILAPLWLRRARKDNGKPDTATLVKEP